MPMADASHADAALQTLEVLTRRMLFEAQASQWTALAATERERRAAIESFFATPPSTDAVPQVARVLREMLDSDRQVLALGAAGRAAIAEDIRKLRLGRRGAGVYRDQSRNLG